MMPKVSPAMVPISIQVRGSSFFLRNPSNSAAAMNTGMALLLSSLKPTISALGKVSGPPPTRWSLTLIVTTCSQIHSQIVTPIAMPTSSLPQRGGLIRYQNAISHSGAT